MIKINLPKKIKNIKKIKTNQDIIENNLIIKKLFKKKIFNDDFLFNKSFSNYKKKDIRISKVTHIPDLTDLYIIYQLLYLNNRINVLEYGAGWSSIIILKALNDIRIKKKSSFYTRLKKPYNLTIVDDNKFFLKKSKKIILSSKYYKKNVDFHYSPCFVTKFNNRYATEYKSHPLVNPDFIFLDGPSQFNIKGKINNFTVNDTEMMPMACDILKFEAFLTPGTIILSDGRTPNITFLKNNFQRNWKHIELEWNDNHILYLDEKSLGIWNSEQLNFYKNR